MTAQAQTGIRYPTMLSRKHKLLSKTKYFARGLPATAENSKDLAVLHTHLEEPVL